MTTQHTTAQSQATAKTARHPGIALAIIASAQLMIVLDATIVNVALPQMQKSLGFSSTDLSWVLNAYTLTFGGLLLLGGRAGDILGRRRVFMFGIALFAFASLMGGFAQSQAWLLSFRALQGVGGAIASPTALALITTNFDEGPARNRAFGVFAAASSAGAAVGLIAGGMLTSWLSWRWTLFVNAPIGAALIYLTPRYIRESKPHPGRFDLAGALTSTLGMGALVYGFIRAADKGWSDDITMMSFALAVVLLAIFALIELRSRQPITPLHLFANRNRSGSYAVMLIFAAAMFGMFFFLTLFVQNVLGYSPLRAGFSFVPVTIAIAITAGIASKTVPTIGPRRLMIIGGVLAAIGLTWLAQIEESSGYLDGLLFPMLLFGLGMGFIFVPVTIVALTGVRAYESGAGSSLLNVMQMVGGSLGLSILVTVFGTASRNEFEKQFPQFVATAHPTPEQLAQIQQSGQLPDPWGSHILAHGISSAFQVAAALAVLALIVTIVAIRTKASDIDTAAVPGMGGG